MYRLRFWFTTVLAVVFVHPAFAGSATLKERFMATCLAKEPRQHLCACMYESSTAIMSEREMELQIAFLGGDKARQEEIKSDPTFDYPGYNAKGMTGLRKSIECVLRRKREKAL